MRGMKSLQQTKRAKLILYLEKCKIPTSILEYVAKKTRSSIKISTKRLKVYESMNDKALDMLHRAFVRYEIDRAGKFLELRLANYLMKQIKDIAKVDFRKQLIGASKVPHEIDIVGYNDKEEIIAVGESKSRIGASTKDHIAKWLKEIEDIAKSGNYEKLDYAFFMSLGGYTDDAIKMVKDVDKKGRYTIKLGAFSSFYINLIFVEEREGKILKVFPK